MKRIKQAAPKWTWQDDYRLEIATKDSSELFALLNHFEGQALPSERTMECAIMLRLELSSREDNAERLLEGVRF